MQFASNDSERLFKYLKDTTSVTDLLMTGGDPMVQKSHQLRRYLEPLLAPEFDHIQVRTETSLPTSHFLFPVFLL